MSPILTRPIRRATTLLAALVIGHCSLVISRPVANAATFNLETAGIQEIQAAVDAGALTYEKLAKLYLARIEAYDQKGPGLNTVITLNKKILEEARAADAEFKAKGRRSPLHGIPILVKDNFDVVGMPDTGGSFLLEGNMPEKDAPMIKGLRDAGALFLAKVNLDEFAAGGHGFSSLGGQTKNPHNLKHVPLGSSGATGAGLAAWFAPLGLGTDTGGSIRGPCFANGVPGIKPTNGLLSRTGIIPRVLSFDTGGPMARSIYDVAVSLGFMTGVDPADPLTETSAGLFYKDYTVFLKKDSLKGARIGIVRDLLGTDPEVDKVFEAAIAELKSLGAVIVDPINLPSVVESRGAIMDIVRGADIREEYAKYLAGLKGDFPKTLDEMIARADAFTKPRGKITPHPSLYGRFKIDNAGAPSTSLLYKSAKVHGMAMIRDAVLDAERKAKGPRSPLHGIPVLAKDVFDTFDMPTSGNFKPMEFSQPSRDSFVIARLRASGAIILGKLNQSDWYGVGKNGGGTLKGRVISPYNPARVGGGSSSGTGAAMAAWFSTIGLGSDTTGSVTNPTNLNSLAGMTATHGLVSRTGMMWSSPAQESGGPMTRSVYDTAVVLDAIAGYDPADLPTQDSIGKIPDKPYASFVSKDGLKGARIGVLREMVRTGPGHEEGNVLFEKAVADFKKAGAVIVDPVLTGLDLVAMQNDADTADFERAAAIDAYLAGLPATAPIRTVDEMIAKGGALVKPEIVETAKLRGKLDHLPALAAVYRQQAVMRDALQSLMDKYQLDALIYPNRTLLADETANPPAGGGWRRLSVRNHLHSSTGFPTIVVPAGFIPSDGMPFGVQFLGRKFSEPTLIKLSSGFEAATKHRKAPASTPALAGEKFDY